MGALSLIDAATGEVTRVVDASTLLAAAGITDPTVAEVLDLAAFTENATELERIAKEAKGVVGVELVTRLDKRGSWTLHDGGYTITSPSPEAGTVAYDTALLRVALEDLVERDVISQDGADGALERLQPTASLPYDTIRRAIAVLDGELDMPAEDALHHQLEAVLLGEPDPSFRQKPAGIKALLKVPAARDALVACQVAVVPPRRVAKVKRERVAS